ncbi:MAG TPA: AAA family ATPase [Gammaproteobacteria bacterium]|nr:AAA family ATPase [Gammaproteobacteria bacterium]
MNISQLRPASQLAQRFGVKAVTFGGPGTGKTPLMNTAPRPVACITEPGMLTMRTSNIPAWEAYTPERVDEFFEWLKNSNETRNFDTVCIDSISQMAEIFLTRELARWKDGRKAYGEMSRHMMELLNFMYYMPQKHTYLIAKEGLIELGGVTKRKPYFPGQDLNVKVPHMYDEVWHIGLANVPGQPKPVVAIRTVETFDTFARDRSGRLAELEFPDLTALFNKAMS